MKASYPDAILTLVTVGLTHRTSITTTAEPQPTHEQTKPNSQLKNKYKIQTFTWTC